MRCFGLACWSELKLEAGGQFHRILQGVTESNASSIKQNGVKAQAYLIFCVVALLCVSCYAQKKKDIFERSCPKLISRYNKLHDCERVGFLSDNFGTAVRRKEQNNISCFTYIVSDLEKRTSIEANCLKQYAGYIYRNDSVLRKDLQKWERALCR